MLVFVDELLRAAMAPVLRDLRNAGMLEPSVEGDDWADDPDSASAMLWSQGGSGTGVFVSRSAPEFERVAAMADQVQEWAIEELWGQAPTNWPLCPHHPTGHPMKVSTRDRVAVWTCPSDGTLFSPVGALQARA